MKKSISLAALAASTAVALAGSYQVTIESGDQYPVAWSFQAKTVSQAFPTAWDGTTLYFWDSSNQNWVTISWFDLFGGWDSPNYTINNGVAFLWENASGSARTITVSGTDVTSTSVTRTFTANKWYLIADNYYRASHTTHGHWMECVYQTSYPYNAQYTTIGLGYTGTTGDRADMWNTTLIDFVGGVRTTDSCVFGPFWGKVNATYQCEQPEYAPWGSYVSPQVDPGRGFWFKPAANVTWVVPDLSHEIDCNNP